MSHAEDILNGDNCDTCGVYLDDGEGFPVTCPTCEDGPDDCSDELNGIRYDDRISKDDCKW